jgi:6-phosphogluconolactonase
VDENGKDAAGKPTGLVSAFSVDHSTGGLTLLNAQSVADHGPGPCHVAVDTSGRVLLVANYGGGSVAAFPLLPDGQIGLRSSLEVQTGPLGPRVERQNTPHAHCVVLTPDGSRVYVADLGLDRVYAYRVDADHATLMPDEPAFISVSLGAGPRHVSFSSDGKFLYVGNELNNTIALFEREGASDKYVSRQTIATLPGDFHGENTVAELRFHPNGRFLYVSNRGHDSLAVFACDLDHGTLSLVEIVPCGGKIPRDFALSSDGAWLVCAHQNSNSLAAFAVSASTGKLTQAGPPVSVNSPVCVLFGQRSQEPGVRR